MSFDFQKISESKNAHRRKLAALPIGEKLRLLDAIRERAVAIRASATPEGGASRLRDEPGEYRSPEELKNP